jgi:phosphoadenosine phosphosulfate reductase
MTASQTLGLSGLQPVSELDARLAHVRELLSRELAAVTPGEACLTCSFQAEDVLLLHLTRELQPDIPVLFLDTGYHFAATYSYRDRIAAPDRCCALRKVEPLFAAVANYKLWLTGLRREQARSRAALEEVADFKLPSGVTVRKLSPFADWTTRDVWQLCERFSIPLLPLYDLGYSSIGCEPCTSIPTDPNDPRSGRWAGKKVECGIHIQTTVGSE